MRILKHVSILACVAAAMLLFSGTAYSTIYYVSKSGSDGNPGTTWTLAKQTIQAGINAASSGSEVWVRSDPSAYAERITLKNTVGLYGGFAGSETVRSQRNWATNETIIDGSNGGSVVTIPPVMSCTIDGFTLRNGTGTLSNGRYYGGIIYCIAYGGTIVNNKITGGSAASENVKHSETAPVFN